MQTDRRILFTADARLGLTMAGGAPLKFDGNPRFAEQVAAGGLTLTGYALVWNVPSTNRGGYKVRLLPGSATFATPTLALYHHDFKDVIGNTENDTLRLTPDDYGVKVEIDLPNTGTGRDTAELVGKKYVRGMSFAMVSSPRGHVTKENGQEIFDAEAYAVDEVTVTPIPAFLTAMVGVKTDAKGDYADRTAQALRLERLKFDLLRLPGAELPGRAV